MKPQRFFNAKLMVCLMLMFFLGCSFRDSFQPLPPMFKNWAKDGVAPDDVKQALISCGYDNPYAGFSFQKDITSNDRAKKAIVCGIRDFDIY